MTPYAVGFLTGLTIGVLVGLYLMAVYHLPRNTKERPPTP